MCLNLQLAIKTQGETIQKGYLSCRADEFWSSSFEKNRINKNLKTNERD